MDWFVAFSLTVVAETPVLVVSLPNHRIRALVASSIILNMVTHPIVWFILPKMFSGYTYVIIAEIFAVVAEYLMLRALFRHELKMRIFLASLAMNFTSFYTVGVLQSAHII